MALQTVNFLCELLNPYDKFQHLECDRLSRVFSKVLTDSKINHQLYLGQVKNQNTKQIVSPHFWIELQVKNCNYVVDYRCRRWLGNTIEIPHGIFASFQYPAIIYQGRALL